MAKQKEALWTKDFIFISVANLCMFIGFYMTNPVISKYLVSLQYSLEIAGFVVGIMSFTSLFVRPFCGRFADRINKKKLFIIAVCVESAAIAAYGLTGNLVVICVARVLHGAMFAVTSTTLMAILPQVICSARMGEGMGYFGLVSIIATSFAPSLGLGIGRSVGYRYTFLLGAMITALSMVLVAGLPKLVTTQKSVRSTTGRLQGKVKIGNGRFSLQKILDRFLIRKVILLGIIASLFSLANGIEGSFIALYADHRRIAGISFYFLVSSIVVLISRLFSGRIYDKKGLKFIIYPSLLIAAAGMFVVSISTTLTLLLVGAALKGLGQGMGQPSLQARCMQSVSKEDTGKASSTYYLFPDITQSLGPMVGGVIMAKFGYSSIYLLTAALLLGGCGLSYIYLRRDRYDGKEQ